MVLIYCFYIVLPKLYHHTLGFTLECSWCWLYLTLYLLPLFSNFISMFGSTWHWYVERLSLILLLNMVSSWAKFLFEWGLFYNNIIESFDLILSAFTFNIGWICTFLSSASQALQILHGSRSWCCDATMAYDMLLHIIFTYMWLEWLTVIRNVIFWVPNLTILVTQIEKRFALTLE